MAKDNRALLDEYLATKKLLWKDGNTRFEFQASVTELDDEVRVNTAFFWTDDDGTVHLKHGTMKSQKFLCVGGPLSGQKVTEAEAKEYTVFNRAVFSRGNLNPNIPRAILVYRKSLQPTKKSRK